MRRRRTIPPIGRRLSTVRPMHSSPESLFPALELGQFWTVVRCCFDGCDQSVFDGASNVGVAVAGVPIDVAAAHIVPDVETVEGATESCFVFRGRHGY